MIDDNKNESSVLSEPEIKTQKKRKTKLINSIIISSVCVLISVVVLLVALFVIPNYNDSSNSSSAQTSSESIPILDLNIDNITSFSVKDQFLQKMLKSRKLFIKLKIKLQCGAN